MWQTVDEPSVQVVPARQMPSGNMSWPRLLLGSPRAQCQQQTGAGGVYPSAAIPALPPARRPGWPATHTHHHHVTRYVLLVLISLHRSSRGSRTAFQRRLDEGALRQPREP